MKRSRQIVVILVSLALTLALVASASGAQTSANATLNASVIGNGGGQSASAHYSVEGSIGQPVTENPTVASAKVESGFWNTLNDMLRIYLPLIFK